MTITNLNVFQSGTLASVTPVNENFETLRVAVNTIEQSVTLNRTYLDNKITEINSSIINSANSTKTNGGIFCVNNGPYDVYRDPNILSISGTTLSFNTPFIATNVKGNTTETENISSVSISGYTDGTYNVFVDLEGNIEILNNTIYRQQTKPSDELNAIWLDTSKAPLDAKRYTSNGWIDFLNIPLGCFTIENGEVTNIKTFNYNQNGYNLNTGSNFPMPDYSKGVDKACDVEYTAETSGWLYAYKWINYVNFLSSVVIDDVTLDVSKYYDPTTSSGAGGGMFIPVPKGAVYKGINLSDFKFYPIITM